jgi:hypothetical protein
MSLLPTTNVEHKFDLMQTMAGVGAELSPTGVSGVDDVTAVMALVSKFAKDKLKRDAARLEQVVKMEALTEMLPPGLKEIGSAALKASGNDKDTLMAKLQIDMAEWSQATQAQTNVQKKADDALQAQVANLK